MRTVILLAAALLAFSYGHPVPTWFKVVYIVFFLVSCTVDAFYLVVNLFSAEDIFKAKPKKRTP